MSVSPVSAADLPADAAPAPAESFWSRLWRGARRLRQQPDWQRFAGSDWPDRVMDVAVTDRFHAKQGRTTGRWVLHADGPGPRRLVVYLKRHSTAPWWDRLLATLWPGGGWSPAFKEWEHLEWARSVGVPTPRTVAAAEYVGPAGRLRSFLAVEELHDMLPLSEAVPLAASRLAPADFRRWKRGLIAEVARLTRLLHDRRRFHKDLYLCHFFIRRADAADPDSTWRGRVFLIDLHRLGRHAWSWLWWRMKDLAQLLYSTEIPGIGALDRLYFWRSYRGPGPRRLADRWLVRLVLYKWGRYRRHNTRQKGARGVEERRSEPGKCPGGRGRIVMNIAFCYDSVLPSRGGCETYIASLGRRLAVDGHEIHVYARRWDASALPAGTHYHPIVLPACPRFLRPWFFAAACRRELAASPHQITVGFDKLPGLDVLYPQGGLYAATAEHNLLKYRSRSAASGPSAQQGL